MEIARVTVPLFTGESLEFIIKSGQSLLFLGANGGGKTRLGVLLEENITGATVQRIAAQRALQMKSRIVLEDAETSRQNLLFGASLKQYTHLTDKTLPSMRTGQRWKKNPAVSLLEDFEAVLQALYADQRAVDREFRSNARSSPKTTVPDSKFDKLIDIWRRMLPHRELTVGDGTVSVLPIDALARKSGVSTGEIKARPADFSYEAEQLSDGERVIFYLLGQSLLLDPGGVLIVDEPEIHVHKSLVGTLWDSIEAVRTDCAFIYVSHDVDFAAGRRGAEKFALYGYRSSPSVAWNIEPLPEDDFLPEEIVSQIVGSRRPILFVEGSASGPDASVYRRVYPDHFVIPLGGCDAVITSVSAFNRSGTLHWFRCQGIVDRDDRGEETIQKLKAVGVHALGTSEIENVFLYPEVFAALARTLGFDASAASAKACELADRIFETAARDVEAFAMRFTKRQIDRRLKAVDLPSSSLDDLVAAYQVAVASVDARRIHAEAVASLSDGIARRDLPTVLARYDNKGLLSQAGVVLSMSMKGVQEHIGRMLNAPQGSGFLAAVKARLPELG